MKKSLSMGDISQQQAGGQQITYRPATQQIPEEVDEPGIVMCYSYGLYGLQYSGCIITLP